MIEPFLKSQLEPVARRHRWLRLTRQLALCWTLTALMGLALVLWQRSTGWTSSLTLPLLAIGAAGAAAILWRRSRQWQPDFRQIARQIEQEHPELHALLLTAVEQQPDAAGEFNYLQSRVVREAILESQKQQWIETIPESRLVGMQLAHLAAFVSLAVILLALRATPPGGRSEVRDGDVTVTPGDVFIERGHGLAVLARFEGPLPAEVSLVLEAGLSQSKRVLLVKSLDDPVFGGSIPEVTTDLIYHVEYAGVRTRDYKVRVFEHPRLERADARLAFPEYTGLPEKKIQDTRRVSAVEGSLLDLSLRLNKPVVSAKLLAKDKTVVPLVVETNQAAASLKNFPFQASQSYELQLVDAEGRTNKIPSQFVIDVLKNRTPELKLIFPRGDQRVSPLQELSFRMEVWDDFGLGAYGLTYTLAGAEPETIAVANSAAAKEKRQFTHLLKLESLAAEPDQLLSYFVWADDIGPDGEMRRTSSDMYFAEVRPFEEIFREGQSQEGEAGQAAGNESMKLAELQKQIINATWKLQRQSRAVPRPGSPTATQSQPAQPVAPPSTQYKTDATVLRESQQLALDQAQALKARNPDPRAQILLESVEREMGQALDHLTEAQKTPAPLPSALAAEQSAYAALLKLSAREYQVSQSRSQGGGGGGGGQRNQQQLDQLELKQAEDRYETQRQASPQSNAGQREELQVLNRLKELAQRQQDLNERLQELQTALQEARSEEEREELRRQLKRLRDEEREMLADLDELRQRMEQPQNQSRMAETRQQLEQTRSEMQRAAEALENNSVPQALTAGTRAQRELQQMRDDFRRKNSNQFAEEMREMRTEARQLARNQEELGQKIDALAESKRKTLSDSGESKALATQFQEQKAGLTNLLDQMRSVSEKAEIAEPLLSRQLYETLRKTSQGSLENALTLTEDLLKRGLFSEADQFEQRARGEIDDLKRGIEHAAESVLGDDTEALRLAKRELEELTRELEQEIARAGAGEQGRDNDRGTNSLEGRLSHLPTQESAETGQSIGPRTDQASTSNSESSAQGSGSQTNQSPTSNAGQAASQSKEHGTGELGQRQADSNSGDPQSKPGQDRAGQGVRQQGNSARPSTAQADRSGQDPQGQGSTQAPSSQTGGETRGPATRQNVSPSNRAEAGRGGGRDRAGQPTPLSSFDQAGSAGGEGGGAHGPITGSEYSNWSDRLRDVEEMIDVPELRTEIARVRDRARAMRVEFKRHSKEPQWPLVQSQIAAPLAEVRSRVSEELARRESSDALVPIDRDPVPDKFSELVRRYYEKLGSSE